MNYFHPHDMILKAQKAKYTILIYPAIVIIICFFLSTMGITNDFIKYLSALALLCWLFILVLFRYKRFYPSHDNSEVIAPINGKLISIKHIPNGCILTIRKSFFSSSEIVTCSNSDIPKTLEMDTQQISWDVQGIYVKIFINETINFQSILVGLAVGPAICEVFIPAKYKVLIDETSSISAGETVIAKLEDSQQEEQEPYE